MLENPIKGLSDLERHDPLRKPGVTRKCLLVKKQKSGSARNPQSGDRGDDQAEPTPT